jgi:hypothetical protein
LGIKMCTPTKIEDGQRSGNKLENMLSWRLK